MVEQNLLAYCHIKKIRKCVCESIRILLKNVPKSESRNKNKTKPNQANILSVDS